MLEPAEKRRPILLDAVHFAEHRVPRRAPELPAEYVGEEGVVTELYQLPPPAISRSVIPITLGIMTIVGRGSPSRRPTNTLSSASPSN